MPIENRGVIVTTADFAHGLSSPLDAGDEITNFAGASILTTGAAADGIHAFSGGNTITNAGVIMTTGTFSVGIMLEMAGDVVVNAVGAEIWTFGGGNSDGINAEGGGASITNHGLIAVIGDDVAAIRTNESGNTVVNSATGIIIVQGDLSSGIHLGNRNNTATNAGIIMVSGTDAVAMEFSTDPGESNFFLNTGTLISDGYAITGDSGNDNVENRGVIRGDVSLSSGDDSFDGSLGFLDGVLDGGQGDDLLKSGRLNDVVFGGDGNDILEGGTGADTLDGGTGNDTASYAGSSAGVTVKLWNGTGTGGDAAGDTLTAIENLTGSAFNDTLVGDSGANILKGGDGNDRLFAGGGDDELEGGAGSDMLDGGTGRDTASYVGSLAGVTVKLWNGSGAGGDAAGDTLTGIENLTGSDFNDTLVGDNAKNMLQGGGGNDRLFGGGGNDTLLGGAGADRLDGGAGIDTASYAGSSAGVTVKLWNGTGAGGDAQGDVLTGIENVTGSRHNDTLSGDSGVNRLEGGGGNDRLFGGGGDDILRGGAGNDRLFGQSGADTFVFDGNWGDDTIADFEDGVDILDFSGSGLGIDALTISQVGNDTLIEDFSGNSITLTGIAATDITADDFLF